MDVRYFKEISIKLKKKTVHWSILIDIYIKYIYIYIQKSLKYHNKYIISNGED